MLRPPAVLRVVRALLQRPVKFHRPPQRLRVAAGAVILHQRVDHERLAIDHLPLVHRLAGQIGFPEIAALFLVEEMVEQEPVSLRRRLQVIAPCVAETLPVRQRERPDRSRLRDDGLLLRRGAALHAIVGEQIAAVARVLRRVEPVGQDSFRKLRFEIARALLQRSRRQRRSAAHDHNQRRDQRNPRRLFHGFHRHSISDCIGTPQRVDDGFRRTEKPCQHAA